MAHSIKLLSNVRQTLSERWFKPEQIEKIIPRLSDEQIKQPEALAEIVDCWNKLMGSAPSAGIPDIKTISEFVPRLASPPKNSLMSRYSVNMATILAEVEPDLLRLKPDSLEKRFSKISKLGLVKNAGEMWTVLFNAPRGFFLQDWVDLMKKVYYIEQNVLDLLYDKKDMKVMEVHPLVKSAACVEADFDHIRARYLFAFRSGYKTLSHLYSVQMVINLPNLTNLVLNNDQEYLTKFAPFCSVEEFSSFNNLIKNHDIEKDDIEILEKLTELEALNG